MSKEKIALKDILDNRTKIAKHELNGDPGNFVAAAGRRLPLEKPTKKCRARASHEK